MKKRIIGFAIAFAFIVAIVPGCDLLEDCSSCEYVLYLANVEVERGAPIPYCGDALAEKQSDPGTQVGDNWAIWECK